MCRGEDTYDVKDMSSTSGTYRNDPALGATMNGPVVGAVVGPFVGPGTSGHRPPDVGRPEPG